MMYKVTHPINCSLIGVDGDIQSFLDDLDTYKTVINTPLTTILIHVIMYMNTISEFIRLYNKDLYRTIMGLSSLIEILKDDEQQSQMHSIKVGFLFNPPLYIKSRHHLVF